MIWPPLLPVEQDSHSPRFQVSSRSISGLFEGRAESAVSKRRDKDMENKSYDGRRDGLKDRGRGLDQGDRRWGDERE